MLLQVDAWAAGCLAAELITGAPPFESESRCATYQLIMYREARLPSRISQAARSFITTALAKVGDGLVTALPALAAHWWCSAVVHLFSQPVTADIRELTTAHVLTDRSDRRQRPLS
jgi:serine/threonine protein kinase